MRLTRLPSGPLACVYAEEEDDPRGGGVASGTFKAFSGSVEAEGATEAEALEALEANVRRLSVPPSPEVAAYDLARAAANDAVTPDRSSEPTARYTIYNDPETIRSPRCAASSASPSTGR